jgi:hypothetical protein
MFDIKMDREKIRLVTVNKIDLAQDRDKWCCEQVVVSKVMKV